MKSTIEEILKKEQVYYSTAEGVSMLPMLRPHKDTILIEPCERDLCPMDVALYHIPGGKYILHRVLKVCESEYVICGDNCRRLEYIPKEWVIGKLSGFYRGEREIHLESWRYRCYLFLWCRPWRLRFLILGFKQLGRKVWRKIHG